MFLIKVISILLLVTPILNVLFLYIFKSKHIGYIIKIVHLTIFLTSLYLMLRKIDSSFMLFICNLVALLLLIITEKAYNVILNKDLATLIYQLTNANVISTVFLTPKNIFALTSEGYVIVNCKTSDYIIHKDIQEFSKSEQIILNKLKSGLR